MKTKKHLTENRVKIQTNKQRHSSDVSKKMYTSMIFNEHLKIFVSILYSQMRLVRAIKELEQCTIFSRRYGGLSSTAGSSSGSSDLTRSRSSHALKARDASPLRSATTSTASDDKDGAALSSWARYLKNKYGQVWK